MGKLSASKVKALKKPGLHGDGGTLFLRIAPGGSKSWIQRIMINRKRRDIGLGGWPVITLAEARERAFDNRRAVAHGRDPLAEKRKAKMPTFREATEKTIAALSPRWRSPKVKANWQARLEKYVIPTLGDLPVDRVGREEVLRVLTPLWGKKIETGRKLRQYIKAVLGWSQSHGFIEMNNAGEILDAALPKMPAVQSNFRALPYAEIPEALETIEANGPATAAKLGLRFLILTAARSGEVRGAAWDEIDFEAKTWIIPGDRMKSGKEHRIPLSDEALDVLEKARPLSGGEGVIFPSPMKPGKPLSDMALTKILRDNELAAKATCHGMRSGFRDWCAERGVDREVAEAALAHVVGGVEGAYFRSDLFERRREVMASWGCFVAGSERGKVVRLHA